MSSPTSLPAPPSTNEAYTRFIILCYARTGSTLLASALNASPEIVCFRELFNPLMDGVGFHVDGYDNKSREDRALRDADFRVFLDERVFCEHGPNVGAVGFKLPYQHLWGFPGLLEHLVEDGGLRVLHLKRRNLLRMLVSERIAKATGTWYEAKKRPLRSKFRLSNAPNVARHPLKASGRLWRYFRPPEPDWKARKAPVTLSREECLTFFATFEADHERYIQAFAGHDIWPLDYEDLVEDRNRALADVQQFLNVAPRRLAPTTQKQNPEPLRDLIANYDELHAELQGTPAAAYFD